MHSGISSEQNITVFREINSASKNNYHKSVKIGNWVLSMSCALFILSILVSYPFAELFSIPQQVAGHIGTMVFPGFIKIGYVVRCVGIKGLGLEV
ncbi:hypothetical protein [Alteromonas gracilis]|uniref:hypothetical protein n=1 Tax=Alteromonas gracilis TaxID=1479524 RepID=UPI0030D61DBD